MARPTEAAIRVEADKVEAAVETIFAMFTTNSGNNADDHLELQSASRVIRGLEADLRAFSKAIIKEADMIENARADVRTERTDIGNKIGDSAVSGLADVSRN